MRTLKESLLDNIDIQMNNGDDLIKTYKLAKKELDNIKKICGDLSNWSGDEHEDNTSNKEWQGVAIKYDIFINCSKLSRHFELIGKNLLITIGFYPGLRRWIDEYKFTNVNQPYHSQDRQNNLSIKNYKQAFGYRYDEIGYKNGRGSHSKYTPEQIIKKFILPKFENMEIFEKEIVDVSKTIEIENTKVKFFDGPNI